jgi:hypothetical protein
MSKAKKVGKHKVNRTNSLKRQNIIKENERIINKKFN